MRGIRGRLRYDTGGGRRKPIRGRMNIAIGKLV
jgi:hypothetical protein